MVLIPAGSVQAGVVGTINATTTNTTSTTHHETDINVTLPDAQAYSTTVIGYAYETASLCAQAEGYGYHDYTAYDQTFPVSPSDQEVQNAFAAASSAVNAAVQPDGVLPGRVCSYDQTGPTLTSSSSSTGAAVQVSHTLLGTNTTVSNSVTIGPGEVLFGDDMSQSFFVVAGNTNINTNTGYESFFQNDFQATTTNFATYQITGHKFVSPIVLDLSGSGGIQASGGVYLPHRDQFCISHRALFDFYGNGFPVAMEWVGPKDGLLCVPKADGTVDGTCLFGTSTGYQSGFEQLAARDENMDYRLTGKELEGLMVWQDTNGNARIDAGELHSLQSLGITELSVKPNRMKSSFIMNGKRQAMFDWWPTVLQLKRITRPSV